LSYAETANSSSGPQEAFARALRFLGYRPRSEAEVRGHLSQRHYSAAVIERAVEKLRALNYVNDEMFARDWARSRAQNRGYGPRRIEQELKAKGIGPSLLREVMRELFTAGDEAENAKRILAKKFKGQNLRELKTQRRAAAFLQRHGYGSKVIFDLLRCPIEED